MAHAWWRDVDYEVFNNLQSQIKLLSELRDRYRTALEEIVSSEDCCQCGGSLDAQGIAREALEGK